MNNSRIRLACGPMRLDLIEPACLWLLETELRKAGVKVVFPQSMLSLHNHA